MSRFAILTKVQRGAWADAGQITVNIEQVAAIEAEDGCGGSCSRLTLSGGREVCVRGNHKDIRRAFVSQEVGKRREASVFEQIFGGRW